MLDMEVFDNEFCGGKQDAIVQMGLGPDGKGMISASTSLQTVCVVNVAYPKACVVDEAVLRVKASGLQVRMIA